MLHRETSGCSLQPMQAYSWSFTNILLSRGTSSRDDYWRVEEYWTPERIFEEFPFFDITVDDSQTKLIDYWTSERIFEEFQSSDITVDDLLIKLIDL